MYQWQYPQFGWHFWPFTRHLHPPLVSPRPCSTNEMLDIIIMMFDWDYHQETMVLTTPAGHHRYYKSFQQREIFRQMQAFYLQKVRSSACLALFYSDVCLYSHMRWPLKTEPTFLRCLIPFLLNNRTGVLRWQPGQSVYFLWVLQSVFFFWLSHVPIGLMWYKYIVPLVLISVLWWPSISPYGI